MPQIKNNYSELLKSYLGNSVGNNSLIGQMISSFLTDPMNIAPGMAGWSGAKPVAGDVVKLIDNAVKEAKIMKSLGNNEYLADLLFQSGKRMEDRVPISRMTELLRMRGPE